VVSYPDDLRPQRLAESTQLLNHSLNELEQGGLVRFTTFPWLITEYGYSAFWRARRVDLNGAVLNADSVARFLTMVARRRTCTVMKRQVITTAVLRAETT